jgi:hypothetical protein
MKIGLLLEFNFVSANCWADWISDLDLELPEGSLALAAWIE